MLRSLSGRLLVVTIGVVMLTEVAIFVPSVARFRADYLMERVRRAEIAALTVLAAPDRMVSPTLEAELLRRAEVLNIVVGREGVRELVLTAPELEPVVESYDLRDPGFVELIADALARLMTPQAGVIRVIAPAPAGMGEEMEITLEARPLRAAIIDYGLRVLQLSLLISLITAVMVFFAVRRFVVRPITGVVAEVKRFSENPEDPGRIVRPQSRLTEIADAERAIAEMQREVHAALRARGRLASLGQAVAKISHDLRNILATAQLMADRIEASHDPGVTRTAPKLIASLGRAIRLCESTLAYGKAEEAPPEARLVQLLDLAEEVVDGLGLTPDDPLVRSEVEVPPELTARADPEHLYRMLANLARNAEQAMRTHGRPGALTISAHETDGSVEISVADTGPGMPARAVEHLFQPFRGGTRREGTGLGLAIAHELVRANGGELRLATSTTSGTEFRIILPSGRQAALRATG
ncbi:MAG TPA: HAMP domain-containing sensor histidine kinase [Paracoccaceae bacterium]|nr:HAMP domain-containing sensor histidine kinase [Paracoccaceae bacterium]